MVSNAQLLQHQPLVRRLARLMVAKLPANVELDDLVQAGMIGLWAALVRFDASAGVQFETFATHRINGAMLDELRRADYLSRGQRDDLKAYQAAVHQLQMSLGRFPTMGEAAEAMGLSIDAIEQLRTTYAASTAMSLDGSSDDDERDIVAEISDDGAGSPERLSMIRQTIRNLTQDLQPELARLLDDSLDGLPDVEIAAQEGVSPYIVSQRRRQLQAVIDRLVGDASITPRPKAQPAASLSAKEFRALHLPVMRFSGLVS